MLEIIMLDITKLLTSQPMAVLHEAAETKYLLQELSQCHFLH